MPARRRWIVPVVLFALFLCPFALTPAQPPKADPKAPPPAPAPAPPADVPALLDRIARLEKQLAAGRPAAPSGCAVRARVEKRGESAVAVLSLTLTVRTAAANAPVALGGKGAFLVAATLDGNRLTALDATDDGFAATVETPGDHTVTLDLEAAVGSEGGKPEVGFKVGLPRAAITTLALEPPPDVGRVAVTTRTPDPGSPDKPAVTARTPAVDVKQLAPRDGPGGYPLGPVDLLELAWEPPAAAPADAVQTAEVDVVVSLTDGAVETTARVRPRGAGRVWRVAVPPGATLTAERADRAAPRAAAAGSPEAPVVTRPVDPNKPVWSVELPAGGAAADWVLVVAARGSRPPPAEPAHRGPFPVGPVCVLGAARQTGTVKLSAPANTRLVVDHGPELRQADPPGPADAGEVVAFYKRAADPAGGDYPGGPLLTVEARPLTGRIEVRPAYRVAAADAGWRVQAEVRVVPVRREVDNVRVDLPADWRGPEVGPSELVDGVEAVPAEGGRQGLLVRLAAGQRQPFTLTLAAAAPPGGVGFPQFPGAVQRDATATATAPDGQEVRGTGREWDGDRPAGWPQPLAPVPGADGRPPKAVAAVAGRFDHGLARLDLSLSPYRPDLTAEVQAEVTVQDGQVLVSERVRLRSPDGTARPVRFRGPAGVLGLKAAPPLAPASPGEWVGTPAADGLVTVTYAVPVPPRPPAGAGAWRVPVGLVWPAGTTRAESVVRVWSRLGPGWAVGPPAGDWRELPPEPVADREALPARTLAGSGPDLPLSLELTPAAGGAAAWVERGLIQTQVGDDGTAAYRVRFLVRRWLADAVEVRTPDGLAGPVEVLLDGQRADLIEPRHEARSTNQEPDGSVPGSNFVLRASDFPPLRVPLPEGRPGRGVVVELRYRVAAGDGGEDAAAAVAWPRAAYAGPVRWQVFGPPGTVPLVAGGRSDYRWRLGGGVLAPHPAGGDGAAADRWFDGDPAADAGTGPVEGATVWLAGPEGARVMHAPWAGLVAVGAVAVGLIGLAVTRLPGRLVGPVVAVAGGACAVVAALHPQPAAQLAAAAEPGLAGLGLVLGGRAAVRWYYRRRVTHLPGFARGRPADDLPLAAPVPSSARGRPTPDALAAGSGT